MQIVIITIKMILEAAPLLSVGFLVGLSGAIIPGPLFAFTVLDTTKKGTVTGHRIIVGHVIWESLIIGAIFLGFGWILEAYSSHLYLVGGAVFLIMGFDMVWRRRDPNVVKMERAKVNSSVVGGIFYTALNPTQPIWWATAGLALLLMGLETVGVLGVLFVTAGHWAADFAYYTFLSYAVHRCRRFISPKKLAVALGAFLVVLGAYFIAQGVGAL